MQTADATVKKWLLKKTQLFRIYTTPVWSEQPALSSVKSSTINITMS